MAAIGLGGEDYHSDVMYTCEIYSEYVEICKV